MSTHKRNEHIQRIKSAVKDTVHLDENEKTETIKHLEEWIVEDKAEGLLYEELEAIASGIKEVLSELGLK
jgi:phage-related protein